MKVNLGVSNRHVHLTEEDYVKLFGNNNIEIEKKLVQTGEYASSSKVLIKTDKNIINNVRVLGPFRSYTQVEISKTDSYFLGLNPPIRNSGDLSDGEEITIVGPCGEIKKSCCIIATRHLHLNHEDRIKLGLLGVDTISIRVGSDTKSAVLNNVYVKETEKGVLEIHLDTDDANGNLLKTGDQVELIY